MFNDYNVLSAHIQKTSKMVHVPIFEPLQKFINAVGEDRDTFVTSSHGKHFFTLKSFGNYFKSRGAEARLPTECTIHGFLRGATI
ncbi:Integrase [Candidatus Liberibacter solanacearum]